MKPQKINKENARVGIDCVTPQLNVIEDGLSLIISHFEEPLWPRTISTHTTEDRQVLVHNNNEALARFNQANFLNCKVNAYPYYTEHHGINRQSPNFIFVDLDLSHFNSSKKALDRCLSKTLKNIKEKLNCAYPTVLLSGNGYHIYLPVQAPILELESIFAELDKQPSRKFIQWAEKFLSNNKADPCHYSGLSFKNCMIRIPGSHNSKHRQNTEVKILQKWNGVRPSIKPLLSEFYIFLADSKIKEIRKNRERLDGSIRYPSLYENNNKTRWIETLFQTPIHDHRKYAIWRILAPYLINIKKVSYEEALNIIKVWLGKCDKITPLDFGVNNKIKVNLTAAAKVGYHPMGFSDLKAENKELYSIISNRNGTS
jgi:hypothetical protein